jgi:hypothetical protein
VIFKLPMVWEGSFPLLVCLFYLLGITPGIHWIGGWVGLKTCPQVVESRAFSYPAGNRTLITRSSSHILYSWHIPALPRRRFEDDIKMYVYVKETVIEVADWSGYFMW